MIKHWLPSDIYRAYVDGWLIDAATNSIKRCEPSEDFLDHEDALDYVCRTAELDQSGFNFNDTRGLCHKACRLIADRAGWKRGGDGPGRYYDSKHWDSWKQAVSYACEDHPVFDSVVNVVRHLAEVRVDA